MPKKIIIVGGGMAGLCTGAYLQMNGYDTEIFEMHNLPGGLCTAWKRQGYQFDFCIHWLMGSGPSKNMHRVWKELGAVENRKFVEWDEYIRYKTNSGETFVFYTDPVKLEKEMLRIAPEDKKPVRSFCGALKKLTGFDYPVEQEKAGFFKMVPFLFKMLGVLPVFKKWGGTNVVSFTEQLKSPLLKEVFLGLYENGGMTDFPMMGMMMMLAFMNAKSAGYPIGGSLEFAKAVAKKFTSLGGKIRYGEKVEMITVRGGKAVGIVSNGKEHTADTVISTADGYFTLNTLLEGKHTGPVMENVYSTFKRFPSLLYVSLGIGRNLSGLPVMSSFPLKKQIVLENGALKLDRLSLRVFNFDPTAAPKGKTAAIVMIPTENDAYWTALRDKSKGDYEAEKKKAAEAVIDALEAEYGNIKNAVEVTDVASPATIIRYTGNWHGSFEGFLPTMKTMMKNLPNTLPGLENFYMFGQWTNPGGGLPPCGMGGRSLAQSICKKDGVPFKIK